MQFCRKRQSSTNPRRLIAVCGMLAAILFVRSDSPAVGEDIFIELKPATAPPTVAKSSPSNAPSTGSNTDPNEELLKKYGVTLDVKSMRTYLKSMLPGDDARKMQADLINQLGHDDYHKREAAMKALLRLPVVSAELLKEAVAGPDPEIRWRAGRILQSANQRSSEILYAAYDVIAKRKFEGLAPEILATMSLCTDESLMRIASQSLEATAVRADANLLKSRFEDKTLAVRLAVIRAYSHALDKDADADLNRLLSDENDVIKAEAARGLLTHGKRDALPVLVQLLNSDDLKSRVQAVKFLRAVSGKRFGFIAYESADNRKSATLKWREWVAGNGQTAKLQLPLRETAVELGRTLICNYSRNQIIELDAAGKKVWEHSSGSHPWACQGLTNGHRLVACYSTRTVTEYDAAGKIVWAKTSLPGGPTGVQRLENGNTLVACTDSSKVIEYNRAGDAVWQATITQRPTDATRLESGRTLITLQNGSRVVEVDKAGKVLFEINGLSSPFSAQRLENGNTLVSCIGSGSVVEYDSTGKKIVWSKTGLRSPYQCQRLANGNTLISDQTGVREFDRDGKVKWTYPLSGVSKFHRF